MSNQKALLILNGELDLDKKKVNNIVKDIEIDRIIAVDGGANKARNLELLPDLIIGDLDSITEKTREYYAEENIEVIKYPVEKDKTDSEIAVDYCLKNGIKELYLTAALGGRIDQQLANMNLLEYIWELNLKSRIISNRTEIALVEDQKKFTNKKGFRLSLIPQTKSVKKLTITGCKYNLEARDINRSQSRGISNLIESEEAKISLEKGLLFYVLEKIK